MNTIRDDTLDGRIAARVGLERQARAWSVGDLATRSGVSRAMISKIERGAVRPTASLLGKLSGSFGLSLSQLLARVEDRPSRLSRAAAQQRWKDPETGYTRRALSPPSDSLLQLTEIRLPARAIVRFPAAAYTFVHQQIWVLTGRLTFIEGSDQHELRPGDCLTLGPPADCTFRNRTRQLCRYVVAVARR